MRTVLELLNLSQEHLKKRDVEQPRLEAELLLGHILGKSRLELYLSYNSPLEQAEVDRYRELIRQRAEHKPIQYIIGETEFYGQKIKLNSNVLIPRPETELLPEKVIGFVNENSIFFTGEITIFDIGTGSGCIAVALAKKLAGVKIYASDISKEALKIARENAKTNGVSSKIKFLEDDLEHAFLESGIPQADIVVSNPPYVSEKEMAELPPEVKDYEPLLALNGGVDGLDQIKRLIAAGPKLLRPGGWLFLEIGWKQSENIGRLFDLNGKYEQIGFFPDYHGIDRIVCARKKGVIADEQK